jgi:GTP-binding protein
MFAEIGLPGEEMRIELRLKLMADAALCGLPNAGKSSLLRRISNARPKVGDYPFTTLQPVLGTVDRPDGTQIVVVDVPGLLEGAHEGHGMGHDFLSHFERARMLLHIIELDATPEEIVERFRIISNEVWAFDPRIGQLPQIIVLSKRDLVDDEHVERVKELLMPAIEAAEDKIGTVYAVHTLSAATGQGLAAFMGDLFRHTLNDSDTPIAVNPLGAPDPKYREGPGFRYSVMDEYRVYKPQPRRRRWRIFRSKEGFRIAGDVGLRDLAADAEHNPHRARELDEYLREHGILRALRMAGARDGATVDVFGTSLELWWEDTTDE